MNFEINTIKQNPFTPLSGTMLTNKQGSNRHFEPISNKHSLRAKEEVHLQLQNLINRGVFRPGDRLPPERDLAKQLGVSRPTLRAGINVLAASGIIHSRQGSGNFIAGSDKNEAYDERALPMSVWLHGFSALEIFEAQLSIEMDTAGLAAEFATNEHLTSLSEKIVDMFASLDDPKEFLTHELGYHRIVAAASGNRILTVMLDAVYKVLIEQPNRNIPGEDDLKELADFHRRIYRCIRSRDVGGARVLMRKYLFLRK